MVLIKNTLMNEKRRFKKGAVLKSNTLTWLKKTLITKGDCDAEWVCRFEKKMLNNMWFEKDLEEDSDCVCVQSTTEVTASQRQPISTFYKSPIIPIIPMQPCKGALNLPLKWGPCPWVLRYSGLIMQRVREKVLPYHYNSSRFCMGLPLVD